MKQKKKFWKMNLFKSEQGITLIALIITVLVLLILVGVTINMVTDGGIFHKAKSATEATLQAQAEEEKELLLSEANLDWHMKHEPEDFATYFDRNYVKEEKGIIKNEDGSYTYTSQNGKTVHFTIEGSKPGMPDPEQPEKESYKISYDSNGGEGAPGAQTKTQGQTLKLSNETPTRTGYEFQGWTTNKSNPLAEYQPGADFTLDANTTLYAVWIIQTYTVTYNYRENGGTTATKQVASLSQGNAIDLTPTATKEGWTFVGWNTDKTATKGITSLKMGTSNITLYAIYKKTLIANFYYYNNNTTGTFSPISVTIFNQATSGQITAPIAKGETSTYAFRHWSTSDTADASKTIGANENITISEDTNYYASYTYPVTATYYYYNGNSYTNTQKEITAYMNYKEAKIGQVPTAPEVNTPTGWSNRGWSTNNAANATVETPGEITQNTTYYYSWSKEITATFYYNNKTTANQATVYKNYEGTEMGAKPDIPDVTTPNGWTARGWAANSASVTAEVITPGVITTNQTYYYSWKKDVSISYNANGGNGAPNTNSSGTAYKNWKEETTDANITLSSTKPSKTGYTFVGWNTDKTATTGTIAGENMAVSNSTTVYAIWTPNTNTIYQVIHQKQNIDNDDYTTFETESKTGTTGASITPEVKSYEGFTAPSTQTKTIAADGSTVITYQYARNSYSLTLINGTGIASSSGTATGTVKYGKNVSITATASTGYTFHKWTGNDSAYDSTSNTTSFTMPAKDLTMTAVAVANVYTITLNNQGATTAGTTAIYLKYGDGYYLEPECIHKMTENSNPITIPTKTGYVFCGYQCSPDLLINESGYALKELVNTTSIQYDYTFDAIWAPLTIVPTFDEGLTFAPTCVSISTDKQTLKMGQNTSIGVVVDATFSLAPGATVKSEVTSSSYDEGDMTAKIVLYINGNEESRLQTKGILTYTNTTTMNLTVKLSISAGRMLTDTKVTFADGVKAQFKAETATLTYDANGGSGVPSPQSGIKGCKTFITNTKPTRDGFVFLGWSLNKNATTVGSDLSSGNPIKLTSNITLYAVWQSTEVLTSFSNMLNPNFNVSLTENQQEMSTYVNSNGVATIFPLAPGATVQSSIGISSASQGDTSARLSLYANDTLVSEIKEMGEKVTYTNNTMEDVTIRIYQSAGQLGAATTVTFTDGQKGRFRFKTCTVTFDANGGSGAPEPVTKYEGMVTRNTWLASRSGPYQFLGWSVSKTSTSPDYGLQSDGYVWYGFDQDRTLYAVWQQVGALE